MIETILGLLSYTPVWDLLSKGFDTSSTPGMLYDITQAVAGAHALAKGMVTISEMTPWQRDDVWSRQVLGMTTSAMEFVARLGGAYQKTK